MKAYRILFFLWIANSLLFPTGLAGQCETPLHGMEGSVVFKTGIDVMGSHYSGLFLLKAMPTGEVRILFLSELGLNLLDMEYKNDEFRVVSVKEFLNRKTILNSLQLDFRTLLLDLSLPEKVKYPDRCRLDACTRLKYKHRGQRYVLECSRDGNEVWIQRRKGLFGKSQTLVEEGELMEISISHRGFRMQIDMKEIQR